jgi:hypothetical protein
LVLEEQIVALILASAHIEELPVSYEEALKPAEPEVAEGEGEGEDAAEVLDDATADNAGADDKA